MRFKPPVLCYLTDWTEKKVERGKTVGHIIRERVVLSADKYNWFIWIEREASPGVVYNRKNYSCMRLLFCYLSVYVSDQKNAIDRIIGALVAHTGKAEQLSSSVDPYTIPFKLGLWVDDVYGTAFNRVSDSTVIEKIFKISDKSIEEDQEELTDLEEDATCML